MNPAQEWRKVSAGLEQRARLFNAVLRDLYGPQQLLRYIAGVQDKDYVELHVLRDGRPRRLRVEIY